MRRFDSDPRLQNLSQNGVPVQVTDWQGVMARANQYDFNFQFIDPADSAWIGRRDVAQFFRKILSERYNTQTKIIEIIERS
jgi:hypothetical protein